MSVFTIEVLLAIAGMVLLLAEAFFPKLPLKTFGIAAIGSAIAALLLFLSSSKETASLPGLSLRGINWIAWPFSTKALLSSPQSSSFGCYSFAHRI